MDENERLAAEAMKKAEEDARWKQMLDGMKQMGMDQKDHADQVSETLGEVNVNMATMSANVRNIKEKGAEDRKELRESISKVHERIDPLNGQVQANKQSITDQGSRISDIATKSNKNEDEIVRIQSSMGIEAPKDNKNGLSRLQFWGIIITAVVTLGTATIGAYVTLRTSEKPPVVAPENP